MEKSEGLRSAEEVWARFKGDQLLGAGLELVFVDIIKDRDDELRRVIVDELTKNCGKVALPEGATIGVVVPLEEVLHIVNVAGIDKCDDRLAKAARSASSRYSDPAWEGITEELREHYRKVAVAVVVAYEAIEREKSDGEQ